MNSPATSPSCVKKKVSAVIFDLDGTLLDTENATKSVMRDFLTKYGKELQDREDRCVGMTQNESAKDMVEYYGLPMTPAEFIEQIIPLCRLTWAKARVLPGVSRLLRHLQKHGVPFALASNSVRANIEGKISYLPGWKERFAVILGSDEVEAGKPSPVIFQEAAKRMGVSDPECCLVIEDSGVGFQAAKAAGMNVVAVPSRSESQKVSIADTILHSLLEFQPELWGLPSFDDWINNALPIEHFNLHGFLDNTIFQEYSALSSALIDQIFGRYIGWIKTQQHDEPFKVLVVINGEFSSQKKRIIKVNVINGNIGSDSESSQVQLTLTGYLRSCKNEEVTQFIGEEILAEEISSASSALDLPIFGPEIQVSPHCSDSERY